MKEAQNVIKDVNDQYQKVEDFVREKEVGQKVEDFAKNIRQNIFGRKKWMILFNNILMFATSWQCANFFLLTIMMKISSFKFVDTVGLLAIRQ